MTSTTDRSLLRFIAVAMGGLILAFGSRFWETVKTLLDEGIPPSARLSTALIGFAAAGAVALVLCGWAIVAPSGFLAWGSRVDPKLDRLPAVLRWPLAIGGLLAASATLAYPEGHLLHDVVPRLALLLGGAIVAALLLPAPRAGLAGRLALSVLLAASAFAILKKLILVTDYPFALGWSEGNRLWDYSLYFGRGRYTTEGEFTYPSYLTPGRHGLWGLVFLLPDVGIAVARLWDAFLWILPPLGLGLALGRRAGRLGQGGLLGLGFALWAFLFIDQGPLYAPVVLSAVLLAWGYSRRNLPLTCLVVALASFYAGVSRWTWLVAPGIWGAAWAVLDAEDSTPWRRRLGPAVAIGLAGLAGAVVSQIVMALVFPQPSAPYATTAAQDLLWYRLLPNPTNSLGILVGLAIAVGPVILLGVGLLQQSPRLDRWSRLAIAGASLAFLGVGLAASVKIGGGSNLHNLDMFLLWLVLLAAALAARSDFAEVLRRAPVIAALVVAVPAWHVVTSGGPLALPDPEVAADSLSRLQQEIARAEQRGEVLFIDQRQLFAFGHFPGVPLVLDYELKDLMNQAMASNDSYLDRFHDDLRVNRFAAIVVDPLAVVFQGSVRPFGEENDAWVVAVAAPVLELYEPALRLDEVGVWVYVPRVSEP